MEETDENDEEKMEIFALIKDVRHVELTNDLKK